MKIIIFGANGYIGKHVAKYLVKNGHNVDAVDLIFDDSELKQICNCIQGSILDKVFISDIIKDYDIVYNFAALSSVEVKHADLENAIQTNVVGLNNLLNTSLKHEIKRFVYASSVYALYKKGGIYSITKRAAEDLIYHYNNAFNLNFTILRYGTIYGPTPGQGNSIYRYLKSAVIDRKIDYAGDGNELREFIHIDDAAKLTAQILEEKYANQSLLISGVHSYRINDLFRLIKEMVGEKIQFNYCEGNYDYHYNITPFSYKERISKKVLLNEYTDLHQGLYNIMLNIHKQIKTDEDNSGNSC